MVTVDGTVRLVFVLERAWYYDNPRQWEKIARPEQCRFAAYALRNCRQRLEQGQEVEVFDADNRYVFRFVRRAELTQADWV